MRPIFHLIVSGIVVVMAGLLLGITLENLFTAVLASLFIGTSNALVKPVLQRLQFPTDVPVVGAAIFAFNGLLLPLASLIIPDFSLGNAQWALLLIFCTAAANWAVASIDLSDTNVTPSP